MELQCLHKSGACSSLMLYDFHSGTISLSLFKKRLKDLIEGSLEDRNIESLFGCHTVDEFAFVVASTNGDYKNAAEHLQSLGFTSTEIQFNSKNKTEAQLHFITIPNLFKTLDIKGY